MNSRFTKILLLTLALFLLLTPSLIVYAAVGPQSSPPPSIYDPLNGQVSDIPALITIIVNAVKNIGYFLIVFFIIYSGFLFVKARGNDTEITKAKSVFLWTVVGAAILLGAEILSNVIGGTVNNLESRNTAPIIQQDIV